MKTGHRQNVTFTTRVVSLAIFAQFSLQDSAFCDDPDPYSFRTAISIDQLPGELQKTPYPGSSAEDISRIIMRQPNLVLEGTTLKITAPPSGSARTLMVKRLELKGNSKIVIETVNLEIFAQTIVSEGGEIISFTDDKTAQTRAPDGSDGLPGRPAGTLALHGELRGSDRLAVRLVGQAGQPGGHGLTGPEGVPGVNGGNSSELFGDCSLNSGNGGNGAPGGPGGQGGRGGAGGSGGHLILGGPIALQRFQIDFEASGGRGGVGGVGGHGGPGGPGGRGGKASALCSPGSPGRDGPAGPQGPNGEPGPDGEPGQISAF
jgi:hypothetical protein